MADHTHEAYDVAIRNIDKTLSDSKKRQAAFEETNRREHRKLENKIDGVREAVDENYKLLDAKIEKVEDKVETKIETEIEKVETKIETEIEKVETKIETEIEKVETKIDKVNDKIDKVNDKIDKVLEYMVRLVFDQRQQEANRQFDRVEQEANRQANRAEQEANRQANRVEQETNRAVSMTGIIWTLIVMSTLGVLGHIVTFFVR